MLSAVTALALRRASVATGPARRHNSSAPAAAATAGDGAAEPKPVTGFIGLGNMGGPMAANLLKAGYPLWVYDTNNSVVESLVSKGAKRARSVGELASQVQQAITMLPSSPQVRSVYLGTDGLLANLRTENALLIDASTIDPAAAREVANEAAARKKAVLLDAPVSGGVPGAEAGTLTFMVGGTDDGFRRGKAVLQFMGKNIVHCGGSGNGQVVKVCNNLVLAIAMVGISEGMNLGVKLGMDAKLMQTIFTTTTARSWSNDIYNPVPGVLPTTPASRGYTGGFGVDLMLKDLGLALAAAQSVRAPSPLGAAAQQLYALLSANGAGGKDFSAVYEFLQRRDEHPVKK